MVDIYYRDRCKEMQRKLKALIFNLDTIDVADSKRKRIWELADEIYSLMAEIMTRYR